MAKEVFGVLSLRLRDATKPVTDLSLLLGMPTTRQWAALDPLDRGPNLPARPRGENYWASDMTIRNREFGDAIRTLVATLEQHQQDISAFASDGGKLELYLQLNGELNAGDGLSAALLRSIGDLGCELQIEVFPHFKA